MEKFCLYIEKLLAQHDYVVVPDFGGFVVQLQSAELFSDHIIPPLTTIGFNPLMHHSDGLLAIEIARTEKVSYRFAMEYIVKEVESIKSTLLSSGKIQFGNLGVFYQKDPGNLVFSPAKKIDFLPQNFELNNLYIVHRNSQIVIGKPKLTIVFPSTKIFKYASAAMLIAGLFCISPGINDMRQMNNANLATSVLYNSTQNSIPLKTPSIKVKSSVHPIIKDSDNYHVIVASLQNHLTADKFCKELVSGNFPNAHVLSRSRTYKVAIQSFTERNKAIQCMENLRKTDHRFKTAWVFCN